MPKAATEKKTPVTSTEINLRNFTAAFIRNYTLFRADAFTPSAVRTTVAMLGAAVDCRRL